MQFVLLHCQQIAMGQLLVISMELFLLSMYNLSRVHAHCLTQHMEIVIQLKAAQEGLSNMPGISTALRFEKSQGMAPDGEFQVF